MSDQDITREEWDAHFYQHRRALRNEYPTWPEDRLHRLAREETARLHGMRPAKGGHMNFDWRKNVWKGLRAAAASALTVALVMGVDTLLAHYDSQAELVANGLPVALVPAILALVAMARNAAKVWLAKKAR